MQTCVEIWNYLHDGMIVAVSGTLPSDISLKVEIQYLCDILSSGSSWLWIYLHGCQKFEYIQFEDDRVIKDIHLLDNLELEILSATKENDIQVCCVSGILKMQYIDASYKLSDGTEVTLKAITEAAKKYWSN